MKVLLMTLAAAVAACDGEEPRPPSPCGPYEGVVTGVVDGDTVDLASGVRLRYLLVDAPEIAHPPDPADCFGDEAWAENERLVLGEEVALDYDVECQDRYGRTLAYVTFGGRMINRVLVERGYARVLVIPPNGSAYAGEFQALEAEAQAAGAGLWGACP
jgi:micrococcal nuclease